MLKTSAKATLSVCVGVYKGFRIGKKKMSGRRVAAACDRRQLPRGVGSMASPLLDPRPLRLPFLEADVSRTRGGGGERWGRALSPLGHLARRLRLRCPGGGGCRGGPQRSLPATCYFTARSRPRVWDPGGSAEGAFPSFAAWDTKEPWALPLPISHPPVGSRPPSLSGRSSGSATRLLPSGLPGRGGETGDTGTAGRGNRGQRGGPPPPPDCSGAASARHPSRDPVGPRARGVPVM